MREHPPSALADGTADATVSAPELIAKGFRALERYAVTLRTDEGALSFMRDVLRAGRVVGVLPVDPPRREVILIRQFRLPAHLVYGKGELVEIVAGYVDPGETPEHAAARECVEEIGVAPAAIHELFSFMPAPGLSDEHATMYLAIVDAARVCARAGAAHETEDTRPMRVDFDTAIAALDRGEVRNGYLIQALQWLARNRQRLDQFIAERRA